MTPATDAYLWSLVVVTGAVTLLLRAFPFLIFGSGRRPPRLVDYLGRVISPAAIAMLTVYCFCSYFRDVRLQDHLYGIAELSAGLVVVGLQWWRRNPLLSILAGTVVYMVMVQNFL